MQRTKWKGKVGRNSKKQKREQPLGVWLNDSVGFTQDARLPKKDLPIVRRIFRDLNIEGYNKDQKLTDLEVLLANLLQYRKRLPVAISMNSNDWKSSPYNRVSYFTVRKSPTKGLVYELERQGMIHMRKGFRGESESRKTRIWPTSLLLSYFPEKYHGVYLDPVSLVELKDENGKLVEYKATHQFANRVKRVLERANKVNGQARIEYEGYRIHNPLVAVFYRKFTLHGRIYTRGYRHFQGHSEEERESMSINGEPVVELDFSGFHPRLLYAREGVQFNEDPYTLVDDRPEARPFLKQILLCILNAKDWNTAQDAANYWLRNHHTEREQLREIGITRARPLMEAFKDAHEPISHHFCTGKETGLRVMNKDARIALDVINHFVKQNKPIMPVHDSFVVQAKYRDELHEVMDRTYQKHTDGFTCPID